MVTSRESGCRQSRVVWNEPEFDQLEPERFDLTEHTVQPGLVADWATQERVPAIRLGVQVGECAHDRWPDVAPNQKFVNHVIDADRWQGEHASPGSGEPCLCE